MSLLTLDPQIRTTSLPVSALSAAAAAALASGGGSPVSSPLRRRVSSATSFASSGILSLVSGGSPAASPSGVSILHSATAPQLFTRGRNPRGGEGSAAGSPAAGAGLLRESNLSAMRSTAAGDESLMGHGRIHSAMPDPGTPYSNFGRRIFSAPDSQSPSPHLQAPDPWRSLLHPTSTAAQSGNAGNRGSSHNLGVPGSAGLGGSGGSGSMLQPYGNGSSGSAAGSLGTRHGALTSASLLNPGPPGQTPSLRYPSQQASAAAASAANTVSQSHQHPPTQHGFSPPKEQTPPESSGPLSLPPPLSYAAWGSPKGRAPAAVAGGLAMYDGARVRGPGSRGGGGGGGGLMGPSTGPSASGPDSPGAASQHIPNAFPQRRQDSNGGSPNSPNTPSSSSNPPTPNGVTSKLRPRPPVDASLQHAGGGPPFVRTMARRLSSIALPSLMGPDQRQPTHSTPSSAAQGSGGGGGPVAVTNGSSCSSPEPRAAAAASVTAAAIAISPTSPQVWPVHGNSTDSPLSAHSSGLPPSAYAVAVPPSTGRPGSARVKAVQALVDAVRSRDEEKLRNTIVNLRTASNMCAGINLRHPVTGRTALHESITCNSGAMALLLLDVGADPDVGHATQGPPLLHASAFGELHICELLLAGGRRREGR
ncbi:MAG: hypothetical protein WDW36_009397 [Sanguina aurantia]